MIEKTKRNTRNIIMLILWLMLTLTLGSLAIYSKESIKSDVYISMMQKQRVSYAKYQGREKVPNNISIVYPTSTVLFQDTSSGKRSKPVAEDVERDESEKADFMDDAGKVVFTSGEGSDASLEETARKLLADGKWQGDYEQYRYRTVRHRGVIQVTFLDYAAITKGERKKLLLLIAFGLVGMVLSFFIGDRLARKLMVPVEQNFRMQKQFISDASHELRTPLAVINANVDRIAGGSTDPKHTRYIKNEVRKMSRLTEEMLELARIDDDSHQIEKKRVNLSEITLRETLPYEAVMFDADVELRIDIEPNLIYMGAEDQLTRLVGILVDNASKHVKEGGKVGVRLQSARNKIILSVVNTGDPIPKEERERIFERFYQVDKSRSNSRRNGFGLGLSIAKAIVEAHNGRIYVGSDHDLTGIFAELPMPGQRANPMSQQGAGPTVKVPEESAAETVAADAVAPAAETDSKKS